MPARTYCYCANYYGAANCHNIVSRFGERCKLCKAMNEGRSFRYDFANSSKQGEEEEVWDSEAVADDDDSSSQGSSDDQHRGGTTGIEFMHPRSRRMTH